MSTDANARTPGKILVVVVDDHPLVREGLVSMINREPDLSVVGEAEGLATAGAVVAARQPDVLITDLSLKDGSGLTLIHDLHARYPSLGILVVSMHEEPYYAERAFRAGARGYITKRESTGRIPEAVRRVRQGRIYASSELLEKLAERALHPGAAGPKSPGDLLSDRELEVFQHFGHGLETKQVAQAMHVSIKTVEAYMARIKEKLDLAHINEFIRAAATWTEAGRPK
jgi:DNA-binding NarL/FixJ family response regulator